MAAIGPNAWIELPSSSIARLAASIAPLKSPTRPNPWQSNNASAGIGVEHQRPVSNLGNTAGVDRPLCPYITGG